MAWRRTKRCLSILGTIGLIAGNLLMALPVHWTWGHFSPVCMSPVSLELSRDAARPATLVVQSPEDELVMCLPILIDRTPSLLRAYINRRRIRHITRVGLIAVDVRPANSSGPWQTLTYSAPVVWQPTSSSLLNFKLPDALNLPPGDYEVRARLYASRPWAYPEPSMDAAEQAFRRPTLHAVMFPEVVTETLSVSLPPNADSSSDK
ncbi:MAG: hypothetical protein L0Y44_08905 [Phycisphaerales bacterium]|nr:hypothetical protein [Phycisphaerales bacterium]MCI0630755.1 hypothetical protein [Phycisphaerales bacterium]